eukprot:1156141-Pelagomonas_calceolata.AAC.3
MFSGHPRLASFGLPKGQHKISGCYDHKCRQGSKGQLIEESEVNRPDQGVTGPLLRIICHAAMRTMTQRPLCTLYSFNVSIRGKQNACWLLAYDAGKSAPLRLTPF